MPCAHAPLATPTARNRPPSALELCTDWLLDLLREAAEPIAPREIIALARLNGFGQMTVYRARRLLGDAILEHGAHLRDPNKLWSLAPEAGDAPGTPDSLPQPS